MGVETALIIGAAASAAAAGKGAYDANKARQQAKDVEREQKAVQAKAEESALAERSKQISKQRKQLLMPSTQGGQKSLIAGNMMESGKLG